MTEVGPFVVVVRPAPDMPETIMMSRGSPSGGWEGPRSARWISSVSSWVRGACQTRAPVRVEGVVMGAILAAVSPAPRPW